jgi:hypothetical protein
MIVSPTLPIGADTGTTRVGTAGTSPGVAVVITVWGGADDPQATDTKIKIDGRKTISIFTFIFPPSRTLDEDSFWIHYTWAEYFTFISAI